MQFWSDWNDLRRVDIVVRDVVVPLNLVKVHGLSDARLLVEIAEVTRRGSDNQRCGGRCI